jgi:DNA polymerase III epsilon subunit-like protein
MIVCVFDTETTGLIDNHTRKLDRQPEVIEFACVQADWDDLEDIVDSYSVLIRPRTDVTDTIAVKTKITNEMLKDCTHFDKEIADRLVYFLCGSDLVCGHNLSFDMEMVDFEFERLGRKVVWPPSRICTVEQTIHINGNRINLGDLHMLLTGQKHEGAHRAMPDVLATLDCLRAIRAKGWL